VEKKACSWTEKKARGQVPAVGISAYVRSNHTHLSTSLYHFVTMEYN
jgi:hypothetical protein